MNPDSTQNTTITRTLNTPSPQQRQEVISDAINIARALTSVRLCEECKENLRQLLKVTR
jgi:hypothetical protein